MRRGGDKQPKEDKGGKSKEGKAGGGGAAPKKKQGTLFKRLADAKEGLQIKLAHAGVGAGKGSIDTATNDALVAGAEETTNVVLSQYRVIAKAGKTSSDRHDLIIKAGNALAVQFRGCGELSESQCADFLGRVALFRENECEMDALLMNGFSNGLALALDEYCSKREKKMKSSRTRYDHAMSDYGVAVRKAQVRLGKGPEYMDPTRYLKAAVGREICLQNFEQVTSEHLAEHRSVEDSKYVEVYREFLHAQEAQIRYLAALDTELEDITILAKRVGKWSRREKDQQNQRLMLAQREDFVQEEARLWEAHDDFVRFMANPNMVAATCFLKTADAEAGLHNDELLARALDSWGLSEPLWMEIISRNPPTDESVALFAGNKWLERLLGGYIRVHFTEWFQDCWSPMLDRLTGDPGRYTLGGPRGMSALLTLTEETIERMYDTIESFSPLFARLCSAPHVTAPLIGGWVLKLSLTQPHLFGYKHLPEACRTSAEVLAFILWEILIGRRFSVIEAQRAAQLRMNLTIAHHISENVEMLRSWAGSPAVQQLERMFVDMGRTCLAPVVTVETKLVSVRAGGAVHALVGQCHMRKEQLSTLMLDLDRAVFFKWADLFQKAAVASERGEKRALDPTSFMSPESSTVEDGSDRYDSGSGVLDEDYDEIMAPTTTRRRGADVAADASLAVASNASNSPSGGLSPVNRALVSPRPGEGHRFLPPPRVGNQQRLPTHSRSKSSGDVKPGRPAPPRGPASPAPSPKVVLQKPTKPVPRTPTDNERERPPPVPGKPPRSPRQSPPIARRKSQEDTPPLPPRSPRMRK